MGHFVILDIRYFSMSFIKTLPLMNTMHTWTYTQRHKHKHICYVPVQAKYHYSNSRLKQFWTTRGSCWIAIPFKSSDTQSVSHIHICAHMARHPTQPPIMPSPHLTPKTPENKIYSFIYSFIQSFWPLHYLRGGE